MCRHWHSHKKCADIGTVMRSVQTLAQDLSSPVTSASDSSIMKKHLRYQYLFVFKQAQFVCMSLSFLFFTLSVTSELHLEPFHLFLVLLVVLYL